jgi:hypothetical protein
MLQLPLNTVSSAVHIDDVGSSLKTLANGIRRERRGAESHKTSTTTATTKTKRREKQGALIAANRWVIKVDAHHMDERTHMRVQPETGSRRTAALYTGHFTDAVATRECVGRCVAVAVAAACNGQ